MSHIPPNSKRAFTLIEMLVVIAIISILAGLIFPAVGRSIENAKRTKAANDARALASAITLFTSDHGYLPVPLATQGAPNQDYQNFTQAESRLIIQVLTNQPQNYNQNHRLNTERKVYVNLENIQPDGTLLDPWGQQYWIVLDRSGDNRIRFPQDSPDYFLTRALVISSGRSEDLDTRRDNVANVTFD